MRFNHLYHLKNGMAVLAGFVLLAGSWWMPASCPAATGGGTSAIGTVSFDPVSPATGDSLRAVVQADSQALNGLRYQWKVDGETVQDGTEDTLSHPLKRDDFVELNVIPPEGAMRSNSVFVRNAPPKIHLKGQQIDKDGTYTAQLEVKDPQSDPVTLTLKNGPPGMEIDESSSAIRWKVPSDANGAYGVEVSARNPQGDETLLSFQVRIAWQTADGKANGNASSNSPKQ
jgi:hypothetical protein